MFRPHLVPILVKEKESRISACILNWSVSITMDVAMFWELFSVYYVISVAITIATLLATCFLQSRAFPDEISASETTKANLELNVNYETQFLKKQPILFANKLKESFPEELRAIEKKYSLHLNITKIKLFLLF